MKTNTYCAKYKKKYKNKLPIKKYPNKKRTRRKLHELLAHWQQSSAELVSCKTFEQ